MNAYTVTEATVDHIEVQPIATGSGCGLPEVAVYVGTYGAYSAGSLKGQWVDLEQFTDEAEFWDHCRAIHADEADPEFMLQDWQGIPEGFIGESWIDPAVWQWLDLSEDERECVKVYLSEVDSSQRDLSAILEGYQGAFDDEASWAADLWEQCGMLEAVPEYAQSYIDFESYARDCRLNGDVVFVRHDGRVWAFNGNV